MIPHRRCATSFLLCLSIFSVFIGIAVGGWADKFYDRWPHDHGPVIGIDMGNTNCRVAFEDFMNPGILDHRNFGIIPSCVAFIGDRVLVGKDAADQITKNPRNTICGIKDLLGRKWADSDMQSLIKTLPYNIIEENGLPMILVNIYGQERPVSPDEVYTHLFRGLKEMAEESIRNKVTHIVASVPVSYNAMQRQAFRDAAARANLVIIRLLDEPIAAYMNQHTTWGHSYYPSSNHVKHALIYDMGASKVDLTLLQLEGDDVTNILSTRTLNVGGDHFTQVIVDYFKNQIPEGQLNRLEFDLMLNNSLRLTAEKAKYELSTSLSYPQYHYKTDDALIDGLKISRYKFEELSENLFAQATQPILEFLRDLDLNISDIEDVVVTGASTSMPKLQWMLEETLEGKEPLSSTSSSVLGSAIQGAILTDLVIRPCEVVYRLEHNPLSIGVETEGGIFEKLISRNATLPVTKLMWFKTIADNQTSMLIRVFEGERMLIGNSSHLLLTELLVTDLNPSAKGTSKVLVKITYDTDASLEIIAWGDVASSTKKGYVPYTSARRIPFTYKQEYEKLVQEAEEHTAADQALRDSIVARTGIEKAVPAPKKVPESALPLRDEL